MSKKDPAVPDPQVGQFGLSRDNKTIEMPQISAIGAVSPRRRTVSDIRDATMGKPARDVNPETGREVNGDSYEKR